MDAAARLNKTQTWQATKATSDNESVVQAVSDKVTPGDYQINVEALAMAQSTASASFSSLSTVVGIGTLDIELGSWNTSLSTFATNPNWPKASMTFGPKDTSLEHIRDKINAAGVGVIALVVSDATGSRLVLRSTSPGEANGFKATAEPANGASGEAAQALASMGVDPSTVKGSDALTQPAQDARLNINGRSVKSSQNLIEDEASGLTLRLKATSPDTVKVHVESDTQAMVQDIQSFAHAYNDMASQLAASDPAATDGSLQAARAIQQRMQEAFNADAGKNSLSQPFQSIGIQLNQHGQLEVNASALDTALKEHPAQVEQLFDASGEAGQTSGLATRLLALSRNEDTPSASRTTSTPPSELSSPTAAGAQFRQRLLEQYAQFTASFQHEEEAAMSTNTV